jgi:hypothetical protein
MLFHAPHPSAPFEFPFYLLALAASPINDRFAAHVISHHFTRFAKKLLAALIFSCISARNSGAQ